ncbi:MAG: chorismate-binding protein [Burkholderia sp.]
MIVDLVRNDVSRVDVSRVARTGSVSVRRYSRSSPMPRPVADNLFSTVEAEARPEAGFADLLRALFPCGSIIGAPKHSTMALIDAESTPRGLYTGMLGLALTPVAGRGHLRRLLPCRCRFAR